MKLKDQTRCKITSSEFAAIKNIPHDLLPSQFYECEYKLAGPERNLQRAMFARSWNDIGLILEMRHGSRRLQLHERTEIETLFPWLETHDTLRADPMSLESVCDEMECDPEKVRRYMLAMLEIRPDKIKHPKRIAVIAKLDIGDQCEMY